MNNSNKGEFYFGITDTQIYICFFEEGKNEFEQTLDFEIPDNLSNKLNFKIVQNLLKENIRKLEKDLGFFLNSHQQLFLQSFHQYNSNHMIYFHICNLIVMFLWN